MEKVTVLVVFFLGLSNALFVNRASCPVTETVDNFSLSSFSRGIWYEYGRYPNGFQVNNRTTGYRGYHTRGNIYKIKMVDIPESSPEYLEVEFRVDDSYIDKGEINTRVSFARSTLEKSYKTKFPFFDPNKYLVAYSCHYDENENTLKEQAWVAGRTKTPTATVKAAIDEFINSSQFLDYNKFVWININDVARKSRKRNGF